MLIYPRDPDPQRVCGMWAQFGTSRVMITPTVPGGLLTTLWGIIKHYYRRGHDKRSKVLNPFKIRGLDNMKNLNE